MAFTANKKTETGNIVDYKAPEPVSKSFFGKTMKIEGEITSEEDVTIEGTVNGQLEVGKTLTIGKNGHVNGRISAAVVRISGEAQGHVTAVDKLEISSEGKYTGNIKSDKIMVAEGARLKATINMDDDTPDPAVKKEPVEEPVEVVEAHFMEEAPDEK